MSPPVQLYSFFDDCLAFGKLHRVTLPLSTDVIIFDVRCSVFYVGLILFLWCVLLSRRAWVRGVIDLVESTHPKRFPPRVSNC
jgi:hypothetical protein